MYTYIKVMGIKTKVVYRGEFIFGQKKYNLGVYYNVPAKRYEYFDGVNWHKNIEIEVVYED